MDIELQIGQLANLLNITPKTIRHYHKIGLLPEPTRAENGYRIYSVQSLHRINLIKSLKQVGFSLSDIKSIIDADNPDSTLHQQLYEMLQNVSEQINLLTIRQNNIQALISSEATLDETRQPETTATLDGLHPSFVDLLETLSPHSLAIEMQLYQRIDMFQWGNNYETFLEDISRFLLENRDFLESLIAIFEKVETLPPYDSRLEELASTFMEMLNETPIIKLFKDSSFADDKTLFQTFMTVSQDKLDSVLSPSQKHFFILMDEISQKQF